MKKLTRVKSIAKKCVDCSDGINDRKNCAHADCTLYPYRMGKRPISKIKPGAAIKAFCRWCGNSERGATHDCQDGECPLYAYSPAQIKKAAGLA